MRLSKPVPMMPACVLSNVSCSMTTPTLSRNWTVVVPGLMLPMNSPAADTGSANMKSKLSEISAFDPTAAEEERTFGKELKLLPVMNALSPGLIRLNGPPSRYTSVSPIAVYALPSTRLFPWGRSSKSMMVKLPAAAAKAVWSKYSAATLGLAVAKKITRATISTIAALNRIIT